MIEVFQDIGLYLNHEVDAGTFNQETWVDSQ